MKKFSAGGAQGKYDRRMADIKKDFEKDSKGKSGRALEVLEAKRAQRIADAEDDRAKRMGTDRTATRKAEYDAEKNLSRTRKFGADKPVAKAEPAKSPAPAAAPAAEAPKAKPSSFKEAFKDARSRLGAGKTFTYNGKSFTTNIAGEGKSASRTGTGTGTGTGAGTAGSSTNNNAAASAAAAAKAKQDAAAKAKQDAAAKAKQDAAAKAAAKAKQDAAAKVTGPSTKTGLNPNSIAGMIARGNLFKTSDAFRKSQEAKYGKAKGGKVKKEKTMKYAKGGSTSSKPPQPTAAERAASAKFRKSVKDLKVTPENAAAIGRGNRSTGMAKGGKMATKFGAAMKKKSADTKGRAMMKFAKGGSIDGCAVKGKTKTSMVKMKNGGSC
jgi:hypothetical protein